MQVSSSRRLRMAPAAAAATRKVAQLRAELKKRGMPTTELKKALVKSLTESDEADDMDEEED